MSDNKKGKISNLHIGLIPDGNRRFAQQLGYPTHKGHWHGAKKLEEFLNWCLDYPEIKTISVFALSTENLARTRKEIKELWSIYNTYFKKILTNNKIREKQVKVNFYGNDSYWNHSVKKTIKEVIHATKHYGNIVFNVLLAYGSKYEIDNAVRRVLEKPVVKKTVDALLMIKEPIDLCIRTGGQHRLSNFMLYQNAYSEIYFSKTLFPQFTKEEFDDIIKWYHAQVKKYGK